MKQNQAFEKDIESIRHLMERSVKFLSLSGLSGILAGVYALMGAAVAYSILYMQSNPFQYHDANTKIISISFQLLTIAIGVLALSIISGYWLASRKAKKLGVKIWDSTSRRLLINLAVPLLTGGFFIILLLFQGYYGIVAPACLLFYGLALINASPNLYDEIRYLGYSEIVLGLLCAALPGYGLYFWAFGFGVLHIIYGTVMYKKYDA
jgi:hypothetical protein